MGVALMGVALMGVALMDMAFQGVDLVSLVLQQQIPALNTYARAKLRIT